MKNKTIRIYELMGLIKDGKAPKKIKVDNREYDYNLGDYYSTKGVSLLNDYNLRLCNIEAILEVKVEILSEENDEQHIEMQFPDTFEEFIKLYSFVDDKEIYTNGCELIPTFRLKQWIDHKKEENNEWADIEEIQVGDVYDITKVLNKLIKNQRKIIEKLESKNEK